MHHRVTEKWLIEHVAEVTELNAETIVGGDPEEVAASSSAFLDALDAYNDAKEPTVADWVPIHRRR